MRVVLSVMYDEASGKLDKKRRQYIAMNKHTGKHYAAVYHDREDPNTEDQQEVRTEFKNKSIAAAAWWRLNKKSETNPNGTALYQLLMKKYAAQFKYGNPYSYLRSLVKDDLTIDLTLPSSGTGGGGGNQQQDDDDQFDG